MKLTPTDDQTPNPDVDLIGIVAFEEDVTGTMAASPWVDFPTLAGLLQVSISDQRFKAKIGQTLILETQGRIAARRVALVGAGPKATFKAADYRHAAAALVKLANVVGARSLLIFNNNDHSDVGARLEDVSRRLESLSQGLCLGAYRFEKYLSSEKRVPMSLDSVAIRIDSSIPHETATAAIDRGAHIAHAAGYARDLVNEPAGQLTPTALSTEVGARARSVGLEVAVLGRDECRARGMGMFLAVAQGSHEEPQFIHLTWRPPAARKRIVLVGKGVTFDSGGLSLKTTEGMLEMKADMAGAAAVLSAIMVAAEENLPVEVHAIAACTENMPSGTAYKLGDVLRSMSGKTVEINNTDAEGRLTLGDALTYGLELNPDVVIDFATLTGACVVALGPHTAGVMTNDEDAAAVWMAAAAEAGEDMWRLPLPPRLNEQLKSEIADMRNTGERWGGALTAGLFLKEFVGSTPWIHVDLAGPATTSKDWGCFGKGATGFGVASIVEYLRVLATTAAAKTK
ncbi:MAG: leucyl aminopeptidase [Deltaproteobacteria bacterium]|nr:leucyl aminopeptidase [Deltaproteobacteria bacterium]